jgi:tellurite resistance protein
MKDRELIEAMWGNKDAPKELTDEWLRRFHWAARSKKTLSVFLKEIIRIGEKLNKELGLDERGRPI